MKVLSEDGRIIGNVENGVFTKRVRSTIHMLRKPRAWAIDCKTYLGQVRPNAHTLRVEDRDTGTVYEVDVKVFDQYRGILTRDYAAQYFLTLRHWAIRRGEQGVLI